MSITIKHLDGPLKGDPQKGEVSFGDETNSILIGRAATAEISYPEECIAVDGEHLRLNREADGSYTIELPGSCDVELDGKPAETGDPVTSGSVITVGEGGPRFEVLLPGITIKHREGPLAGTQQFFPDSVDTITFGRPPEATDVAYPEDYTKVGRFHFSLSKRRLGEEGGNKSMRGAYYVQDVTPDHYVEIGGVAADNGVAVNSGSEFRLGNDDGPTFGVSINQPKAAGIKTEMGKVAKPVRQEVKETNQKLDETGGRLDQTRKQAIYALGGLAAAICAVVIFDVVRDAQHASEVQQLADQLASVDDTLAKKAAEEIDDKERQAILAAVYLVAKMENGVPVGKATAWAFAPNMLATNAHVTSEMHLKEDTWILIGPKGERIPIEDVKTHPGYASFKDYLPTVGGTKGGKFEQLDVINEYDVGIIIPGKPLPAEGRAQPATLNPATEDEVESLKPGAAVAAVGFPIEGMTANMVVEHAPATLHFGNISSLTDVFMCRADDAKDQLLIQHTVPVTGGMSGSPLVDGSGKVVGIVSGGNTDRFVTEVTVPKGADEATNADGPGNNKLEIDTMRIPSAAMVNFAQRIDLLQALTSGAVDLDAQRSYWDKVAGKFTSVFDSAKADLLASVGLDQPAGEQVRTGTLEPRKVGASSLDSQGHAFVFEPGHVYGVIAKSKSGLPIAMNITRQKQDTAKDAPPEFLKSKLDPAKTPVSPLAPATWVTVEETTPVEVNVFAMTKQPADYELYVYDWVKPADSPSADASTTPQP